jgi:tetratricopeptide (TPR) repeat protein
VAGALDVLVWPSETFRSESGLEADFRLECSVQRKGTDAAWFLRLDETGGSETAWEEKTEVPASDVYRVSRDAAIHIAGAAGLDSLAAARGFRELPGDLFETYLEARACLADTGMQAADCSVQSFKQVLKTDSTFLPAWIGLSDAYLSVLQSRRGANRIFLQLAQDAAMRAVRIDSTDGRARFALGESYRMWGDLRSAENEYRSAVLRNPNLPEAWTRLGELVHTSKTRTPSGFEAYDQALKRSPYTPKAAAAKATMLMGLGRIEDAERVLERSVRWNPSDGLLRSTYALSLLYTKRVQEALEEAAKSPMTGPQAPFSHAVLAMALASTGRPDDALAEVSLQVEPYTAGNAALCTAVAAVYSLLERYGLSLQWLDKALSQGYSDYPWMSRDPHFDGMRQDPRFKAFMERLRSEWDKNPSR